MKRKTTRLTFTEEELANPNVRRAAQKAARAADRADKAKAKLSTRAPPKRGLKIDADKAKERSAQLRFGKAEFSEEIAKPKRRRPGAEAVLGGETHRQIDRQNQDENTGVQAAHEGERLAEGAAKKLKDGKYSKKLKAYKKAEKLDKAADKANLQALYRKQQAAQPTSNPISRWKQRQQIKASYYARKTGGKAGGSAANTARSAATQKAKAAAAKAAQFVSTHAHMILMGGVLALVILVIFSFVTSCSVFFPGGTGTVWITSYTAEDEDILGAEADYQALEEALRAEIAAIPSSYPDYDEYTWDLDPIAHDPHELAAVLTAIHEAYTRGEVQGTMQSIFDAQYELILTETIEIRTRTETRTGTDPTTGDTYTYEVEVQYEWKIPTASTAWPAGCCPATIWTATTSCRRPRATGPSCSAGCRWGMVQTAQERRVSTTRCWQKHCLTPSSPPCWKKPKSTWAHLTSGVARRRKQVLTVPGTSAGC